MSEGLGDILAQRDSIKNALDHWILPWLSQHGCVGVLGFADHKGNIYTHPVSVNDLSAHEAFVWTAIAETALLGVRGNSAEGVSSCRLKHTGLTAVFAGRCEREAQGYDASWLLHYVSEGMLVGLTGVAAGH